MSHDISWRSSFSLSETDPSVLTCVLEVIGLLCRRHAELKGVVAAGTKC